MSQKPKCSDGQVHPQISAGASVVQAINAVGGIVLWDSRNRLLRVIHCPHLTPVIRSRVVFNFEAIVLYLEAQAREQAD